MDDSKLKRWAATWEKAGRNLAALKNAELQKEDYYLKHRELLNDMLQYACDHAVPRTGSGLVEQQRLFKIVKSKLDSESK